MIGPIVGASDGVVAVEALAKVDHWLVADAVRALGIVMPGDVKVFSVSELEDALAWAAS
jgi:Ni,Fe-hydrogenase maturation factor